MNERSITEPVDKDVALVWLELLGYSVLHGPIIAAGMVGADRSDRNYRDMAMERFPRQVLVRHNLGKHGDGTEESE